MEKVAFKLKEGESMATLQEYLRSGSHQEKIESAISGAHWESFLRKINLERKDLLYEFYKRFLEGQQVLIRISKNHPDLSLEQLKVIATQSRLLWKALLFHDISSLVSRVEITPVDILWAARLGETAIANHPNSSRESLASPLKALIREDG